MYMRVHKLPSVTWLTKVVKFTQVLWWYCNVFSVCVCVFINIFCYCSRIARMTFCQFVAPFSTSHQRFDCHCMLLFYLFSRCASDRVYCKCLWFSFVTEKNLFAQLLASLLLCTDKPIFYTDSTEFSLLNSEMYCKKNIYIHIYRKVTKTKKYL